MTEPTGIYIDYDTVQRRSAEAQEGRKYRLRPPDKTCLHANADYPMSSEAMRLRDLVDVVCLDCGMRWRVVPQPRRSLP